MAASDSRIARATRRKALVAGALGIVGRHVVDHLSVAGGWEVIGVARSQPIDAPRCRLVTVDLADTAACRELVARNRDVTHLFFAARAASTDPEVERDANVAMLANLLKPLDATASGFEHVCLVQGTKWYGSHLGPYTTPAKEHHPRHSGLNYYYDQLDYCSSLQQGKRWTWSTLRPHVVCGYSLGYPHNIVAVIAVHAAISRALGLPLRFPGTQACFDAVSQATDARILARAAEWSSTEPQCANESFNVVNGDVFRWRNLWPRIARHFAMENGGVRTVSLAETMADKQPLWQSIVERHRLRPLPLSAIADWRYADFSLDRGWDHISSTIKSRRFGFQDCIDTEEMFLEHVERFRAERVIP